MEMLTHTKSSRTIIGKVATLQHQMHPLTKEWFMLSKIPLLDK